MGAMQDEADRICSIADVQAAALRLKGIAVRTPLLRNAALDDLTRGSILLKPENLQHVGAFKFRGAYNRLVQFSEAERRRGVVAWSSGNHAQGVAMAARLLGMPATIVMPADTPDVKLANTRALGASVRLYDRFAEDREAIGKAIAHENDAIIVPPYDDRDIMAGQGTLGIEIVEDAGALRLTIDDVVICCGGGGLIAGASTAIKALSPASRVWAVEPAGHDDTRRSLDQGRRVANDPAARSVCDALLAPTPGELTFAVNRVRLAGGLVVTDDEALDAVAFARDVLKLVLEPGGAVALACVLSGKIDVRGKVIAVVLSGGNIDPLVLASAKRLRH